MRFSLASPGMKTSWWSLSFATAESCRANVVAAISSNFLDMLSPLFGSEQFSFQPLDALCPVCDSNTTNRTTVRFTRGLVHRSYASELKRRVQRQILGADSDSAVAVFA